MKKRFPTLFRRTTALLCALSLTVPAASAASSQYEEILQTEQQIVDGLTYYNTIASTKGGRIESYLLEMEKGADVSPMLMSADGTIYGGSTISSAVKYAREQGHHVLAAINTDFFSSSSGVPMGIVIQDGVYQSSPEKEAAILKAQAEKEAAILKAAGEAEAIREVQQALADSLEMLNKAAPADSVLKLKAIEAMQHVADGQATKIIIPSEMQGLVGLANGIVEGAGK